MITRCSTGSYFFPLLSAHGKSFVVRLTLAAMLAWLCLPTQAQAGDAVSWASPVSGNWSDASKWTPHAPNPGDDVSINAPGTYTVTLDVSASVFTFLLGAPSGTQTLVISGNVLDVAAGGVVAPGGRIAMTLGTLSSGSIFSMAGTFDWAGGALTGTGPYVIGAFATVSLSSDANKTLNATTLQNQSATFAWTDGDLVMVNGAVLENKPGATITHNPDGIDLFITTSGAPASRVENQGTLVVNSTGAVLTVAPVFNNSGTINLSGGSLQLEGGGSNSGAIDGFSPEMIRYGAGSYTWNLGTTVSADILVGAAAQLDVAANVSIGDMTLLGVVSGTGTLTLGGILDWQSGTLTGGGTVNIDSDGHLMLTGSATHFLDGKPVVNGGQLSSAVFGSVVLKNGALINNTAGHTFTIGNATTFTDGGGAPSSIQNQGTIIKQIDLGTAVLGVPVVNTGTLSAQTGRLEFTILDNSGILTTVTGGTSPSIALGNGLHTFASGTSVTADSLLFDGGGTLSVTGLSTISSSTTFDFDVGTIAGTGELRVQGTMNWLGGSLKSAGSLVVTNSGFLQLSGSADKTIDGKLVSVDSSGMAWDGSGDILFQNGGVLEINSGGTFDFSSDGAMTDTGIGAPGEFRHKGTATRFGPAGTTTFNTRVNSSGMMNILVGRIAFNNSPSHSIGGLITGSPGTAVEIQGGTTTVSGFGALGTPSLEVSAGTLDINVSGALPGVTSILVTGGALNLNAAIVTGATVGFAGGVLGGTGNVTLTSPIGWTGGQITGPGIFTLSSGGALGPAGLKTVDTKTLKINGLLNWAGANIELKNGALLEILAGGTLDAQGDLSITFGGGAIPTFSNNGLFKKSLGSGTTLIDAVFSSAGTVTLINGSLSLNRDSTIAGPVNGAVGSVLTLGPGNHVWGSGFSTTVASIQHHAGGILTVVGPVSLGSGTSIDFDTGIIGGAGNLSMLGTLNWSGGTLAGSGQLTIQPGGNLNLTGPATKSVDGKPLDLRGTGNWTGGDLGFSNGALWLCDTGAVFQTSVSKSMLHTGGAASVLTILGNFFKFGDPGTTSVEIHIDNFGSIAVNAGELKLLGNSDNFGFITGPGGTTLHYNGGTHTWGSGSSVLGLSIVIGGELSVDAPHSLASSVAVEIQPGGTLTGSASVDIFGTLAWGGGGMGGTGTTTMKPGSTLNLVSLGVATLDTRRLVVQGTANWFPSVGDSGGILDMGNGARLEIQSGSVFDVKANVQIANLGGSPLIVNAGTLKKTSTPGTLRMDPLYANSGIFHSMAGGIQFAGSGTNAPGSSLVVDAGSFAEFQGGSHLFAAGSSAAGSDLRFSSGTTDFNVAPSGSPAVQVGGGIVNFNVPSTINSLMLSAGTACGSGDLTVAGTLDWSGGSISGGGVFTKIMGNASILGGGAKTLDSRRLILQGTAGSSGTGPINLANGAIIENEGLFQIQSTGPLIHSAGAVPLFQNDGEVSAEHSGLVSFGVPFQNSAGSAGLTLKSGTLSVPGATFANSSTIKVVASGITAGASYGQLSLGGPATLAGNFSLELTVPYTPSPGDTIIPIVFGSPTGVFSSYTGLNQGAKGTFTGVVTASSFELTAAGPGAGASFTWGGSRSTDWFNANNWTPIGVPGSADDATINIGIVQLGSATTVKRLILNGGSLGGTASLSVGTQMTWTGGEMKDAGSTFLTASALGTISGASQKLLRGGRLLINNGTILWSGSGNIEAQEGSSVVSSAVFEMQSDAKFVDNAIGAPPLFDNLGVLSKTGGTGISEVRWTVNNAGLLQVSSGIVELYASGGPGTFKPFPGSKIDFKGGTHTLGGATFDGGGASCLHAGATIIVPPGNTATVLGGSLFRFIDGEVKGLGTFDIFGSLEWDGGAMSDAGVTRINPLGTMTISGPASKTLNAGRGILNSGTVDWTGAGDIIGHSGVVILNSGSFNIDAPASMVVGSGAPKFRNTSNVLKSGGGGTTTINFSFENAGALAIDDGQLTINGNYSPEATASHSFLLSGTTPGTEYGSLSVTGIYAAAGTFALNFIPLTFTPSPPESYTLITYATKSGSFTPLAIPIVTGSTGFSIDFGATAVTALAISTTLPPTISPTPNQTTTEDSNIVVNFTVGDAEDPAAALIATATSSNPAVVPPAGLVFSGSGASRTLTLVPIPNASGLTTISLVVTDTSSKSTTNIFTATFLPVNDPPTIGAIPGPTIPEDTGIFTVPFAGVSSGAPDEIQVLTVTATSSNPALILAPAISYTSPSPGGTLTFTPAANASGASTITVRVTDDLGASTTSIFVFTVTSVNDAPTVSPVSGVVVAEDSGLQTVPLTGITAGPGETQVLTITATSSDTSIVPHPSISYSSPSATGVLSFTPVPNANGVVSITVTVKDDGGTASGGVDTTTLFFPVTVTALNDPPSLAGPVSLSAVEDVPILVPSVSVSDVDIGAGVMLLDLGVLHGTLTFGSTTGLTFVAPNLNGTARVVATGTLAALNAALPTLSYRALLGYSGPDSLNGLVNDAPPSGAVGTRTLPISVAPKNTPPGITLISDQTMDEDGTITVGFTLSDLETPVEALTPTAAASSGLIVPPTGFSFAGVGASRTVKITPAPNANGPVNITVSVTDGGGATASRTFTLNINPVNDPPVIDPIAIVTALEDGPEFFVPIHLSDPDGGLSTLTVSTKVTGPDLVSIKQSGTGADRTLQLTPLPDQSGESEITVTVSDGLLSSNQSFKVNVAPQNDPPLLAPLKDRETNEDTAVLVDLLVTDLDSPLAFSTYSFRSDNISLLPESAYQVTRDRTGAQLKITPTPNRSGAARITVVVTDNGGLSATQSFLLNVLPVNDPPTLDTIANQSTKQGVPITGINVSIGDVDDDLAALKFSVESSNATLIPPGNVVVEGIGPKRLMKIIPADGQFGASTLTLFVSDGKSSASTIFEVAVEFVNQKPEISPLSDLALSEDEVSPLVFFNVADPEDDAASLKVSVKSSDTRLFPEGRIDLSGDGINRTLRLRPAPNQFGEATVTVRVADKDGGAVEASFKATVKSVNDLPLISKIDDQKVPAEATSEPVEFKIEDAETDAAKLVVSSETSDAALIPKSGIGLSGDGGTRRLRITPAPGKAGQATITLTVTDQDGGSASVKFLVTVVPAKPVIVTQPLPLRLARGKDAEFSVVANGIGLKYRWFFNEQLIPLESGSKLLLKSITFNNAGRYAVEVANASGLVLSDAVPLQVVIAPTIIIPPTSQTVALGENVSFSVVANGTAPLIYEWFFKGNPIAGADGKSLHINAANPDNPGDYTVRISNDGGSVSSVPVSLTVLVPPSIGEQPVGRTVRPGERVTLRVRVNGDGPFEYQWRRNGVNIPGETRDTLDIVNVQAENSGSYTVVIRAPSGTTTSDAAEIIVVVEETVFGDNFVDRILLPGAAGSLKGSSLLATAESSEPFHAGRRPAKSVWARWTAPSDGIATFGTTGSSFDTVLAVYAGASLGTLSAVASDDDNGGFLTSRARFNVLAGREYAIAVDGVGGGAGTVVLSWSLETTVRRVPRILAGPADQTVLEGGTAVFHVTAVDDGGAPLQFQWLQDGDILRGETRDTLEVRNVTIQRLGRYQVEVSNGDSAVRSAPAKLVIGSTESGGVATGVAPEDKFTDASPGGNGAAVARAARRSGFTLAGGVVSAGFDAQRLEKSGTAVARGYSGSQIFNSFGSTTEAGEPNHCGVIGGASQWFTYQAEADGTLLISTGGSDFNTVLAIYTGSGVDFDSLTQIACDDNSGPNGATSLVRFTATAGTVYYIAVDGVNGATGRVKLTYQLDVPLRLQSTASVGGGAEGFNLALAAQQSGVYTLQASTNMLDWFAVATTNLTVARGSTATASLKDTNAVNNVFRFYRAVFLPLP